MNIPSDPFILLSYINTLLRDRYSSLDALCKGEDIEKQQLIDKLHDAGFDYLEQVNKFR